MPFSAKYKLQWQVQIAVWLQVQSAHVIMMEYCTRVTRSLGITPWNLRLFRTHSVSRPLTSRLRAYNIFIIGCARRLFLVFQYGSLVSDCCFVFMSSAVMSLDHSLTTQWPCTMTTRDNCAVSEIEINAEPRNHPFSRASLQHILLGSYGFVARSVA